MKSEVEEAMTLGCFLGVFRLGWVEYGMLVWHDHRGGTCQHMVAVWGRCCPRTCTCRRGCV